MLAGAGGALEFLDFTIYALFARYLSHNFFPESESLSALLNTFGIFAVGYFYVCDLGQCFGGGSLGYALSSHLDAQAMLEWGWRVPFVLGSVLALIAYFLRKKALETPVFLQLMQEHATQNFPLATVTKTALPQLLVGVGLTALSGITIFLFLYLPSYPLVQDRYNATDLYFINTLAFLTLSVSTAGFGMLSDYVGRKRLMLMGTVSAVVLGYFLFCLLFAQSVEDLLLFCLGIAVLVGSVNGCYGCAIAELFSPKIRYTGMGISYNIGFALFGGLSTFVMTILVQLTHAPLALYYLLAACGLVTLFAAARIKEKSVVGQIVQRVSL